MAPAFPATSPSISNSQHRSVTPAMNNIRRASPSPASKQLGAAGPGRYVDSFSAPDNTDVPSSPHVQVGTPTSSGLIRLTLRKPMGIVFEPMYDPNAPSIQRGVRVCDLPRTGAAALSRKLEVGDELLSINDKTMSRLTFDEIMDFIIEADPEEVNLLFRRPRKEVLHARMGIKTPTATPSGPGVKWVDDDSRNKNGDSVTAGTSSGPTSSKGGKNGGSSSDKVDGGAGGEKRRSKKDRRSRRSRGAKDDDETLQSEDQDDRPARRGRDRKISGRRKKEPYETESFLDILIDTICANPDSVCRDRRGGRGRDDYYSDDDETFASRDDSTYVTYESEDHSKIKKKLKEKAKGQKRQDDEESSEYEETEDDTFDDKRGSNKREKNLKRSSPPMDTKMPDHRSEKIKSNVNSGKYEDDGTLETVDSNDRAKALEGVMAEHTPPLGLAPNPEPIGIGQVAAVDTDDDTKNPAPIKEVEYDEDNGADVSVMESLGGPSLLIEKQRQAAAAVTSKVPAPPVPQDVMDNFGRDYPLDFGFSREQTIQNDPLRFYTFVVKGLLQEHEPEKVRLLDKLLAKYRGREDHLVQKLSVRYNKDDEIQDDGLGQARSFEEAVNQNKSSALANAAIQAARERMQNNEFEADQWPEKETKQAEFEDEQHHQQRQQQHGDGPSDNDSEYSSDSIDGTSPAVIAQVSELLNYVYGKTSVPGQIDRVSTIMRAYEGREAVLLELLETKALIKANREKENAGQLPAFLRDSANAQRDINEMPVSDGDVPPVTPMAQAAINDDISSMSGVSSPAEGQQNTVNAGVLKQIAVRLDISRILSFSMLLFKF